MVQPDLSERIPLSETPLTWSSIAYILWDALDPNAFTLEQQAALVDWLHWGGQIIVNGPGSLDLLAGSFLEPYLPATSIGSRNITNDDVADLNRWWLIPTRRENPKPIELEKPWSGSALEIHAKAKIRTLDQV